MLSGTLSGFFIAALFCSAAEPPQPAAPPEPEVQIGVVNVTLDGTSVVTDFKVVKSELEDVIRKKGQQQTVTAVEEKLDRILSKLEDVDRRLRHLEENQSARGIPVGHYDGSLLDVLNVALGVIGVSIVPQDDPNRRTLELLNDSENLRKIEYEWERIWFTDQPSHLTPEQIHGPASENSTGQTPRSYITDSGADHYQAPGLQRALQESEPPKDVEPVRVHGGIQ